tara:strand:+ start:9439 stop:10416 length:978 start_codon:yes stop_codon:yes gene_type:complete
MQKGKAFVLSNDSFLMPHGASIVLAPLTQKGLLSAHAVPSFESSLVNAGKIKLSDLESNGIEKLFLISMADLKNVEFFFNEKVVVSPERDDEMRTWVSFCIYKHKSDWKVRFVDEIVSGNDVLLRYLKIDEPIDLITPCNKKYSAADAIKAQAASLKGAKGSDEIKQGASTLAKSLANEGMSIFRRLKGKVSSTASQIKNQSFLDAVCAASALIAFADGYASEEELNKLLTVVKNDELLSVYDDVNVRLTFLRYVDALQKDIIVGEGKAMAAIVPFANKSEADVILAVCLGIALAEHGMDDDEKDAIVRISNKLNINPDDLLGRV